MQFVGDNVSESEGLEVSESDVEVSESDVGRQCGLGRVPSYPGPFSKRAAPTSVVQIFMTEPCCIARAVPGLKSFLIIAYVGHAMHSGIVSRQLVVLFWNPFASGPRSFSGASSKRLSS